MRRHDEIDRQGHDRKARKSARTIGRGDGIDERVPDRGLGVFLNQRQDAVGADQRQSGRSHHQPREYAALHIERVLRHLVDVGAVDDIGVCNQPVARGRKQAGHRSGIASMPADIGVYAGRHHQDGREALAALMRSGTKIHISSAIAPGDSAPGRREHRSRNQYGPSPVRVATKRNGMASAGRFSPRWAAMCDRS